MNRVLVIGSGGSGKSTLSLQLGERTGLPVVHLDGVFWNPGWDRIDPDEWQAVTTDILAEERWILDGNYGSTMVRRVERADTIIFLDMPRLLCLWRVISRWLRFRGQNRPSLPAGCEETISLEFILWILGYPQTRRPGVMALLEQARTDDKRVVVLSSRRAVRRFLREADVRGPKSRRASENPFAPFLGGGRPVILDGGLATGLEARGHDLADHLWSSRILVEDPAEIRAVHEAYLRAGADCITTASYQATVEGFARIGLSRVDALAILDRSTTLALEARDNVCPRLPESSDMPGRTGHTRRAWRARRSRPLVAASVGPYGAFLADGSEYTGRYDLDEVGLYSFHAERFRRLSRSGADLLACETIPSLVEARVLTRLIAESDQWAWLSFSCMDGAHLNDGTPMEEAIDAVRDTPGLAALGVNCTAPRFVAELVRRIRSRTDTPVIVYPNSGEVYDAETKTWNADPANVEWEEGPSEWVRSGARIIGGCCRVGPDAIARLRARSEPRTSPKQP
jgi:homocysteine S-methyltransferase